MKYKNNTINVIYKKVLAATNNFKNTFEIFNSVSNNYSKSNILGFSKHADDKNYRTMSEDDLLFFLDSLIIYNNKNNKK